MTYHSVGRSVNAIDTLPYHLSATNKTTNECLKLNSKIKYKIKPTKL